MAIRRVVKYHRYLKNLVSYLRLLRNLEYDHLKVHLVKESRYLQAAKRVHAEVYLRWGYVELDDIYGGKLSQRADPYQRHSQYFVVTDRDGRDVLATARQIQAVRRAGHYSFPMFSKVHLYKRARQLIATHAPEDCVEISALAKRRAVDSVAPLLLYREMWHHSLHKKHQLWLMACDERLFDKLKVLFGPAIMKAGKSTYYMGSYVVPAILKVPNVVSSLGVAVNRSPFMVRVVRRGMLQFLVSGLDEDLLLPEERNVLIGMRHNWHRKQKGKTS